MQSIYGENLVLKDKLTIEHLMPQEWKSNWPLPEDATTLDHDRRNRLIHTIGNLTLLSGKLNPAISNGAWDVKLEEIRKHSRLNLNASLGELWPEWGEKAIMVRSEKLFDLAKKIWPR